MHQPLSPLQSIESPDIKIISSDSSQAAQQAAAHCRDLSEALEKADYRRFEQIAQDLIALAQHRLAEFDAAKRVENPMAVVEALIGLLEKNAQLQQAGASIKLVLARALHTYLDLMIIENYERPDAGKLRILEETKKRYLKAIGNCRALCLPQAWDIRYELDCCYENIKALEDNHSLLSDLKTFLTAAATKDISGLLSLAVELHGRINQAWQVDVLLMRRLTPLAQRSPKILTMLQELMAGLRKSDSFPIAYAAQESLYHVIANSVGEDKAILRQQAFGLGQSKEAERKALTMQYLEGRHANHSRPMHLDSAIYKSDAHRYRFVQAVKALCQFPGEEKEAGTVREQSLDMLLRLTLSEPPKLSVSRQWITQALADIIKGMKKPDLKPEQAIQAAQVQQAEEQKELKIAQDQLAAEQKRLAEDKQLSASQHDDEQAADIQRREHALAIRQKDIEMALVEHQRSKEKLQYESERLNALVRDQSDYALALTLWAKELAKQAKKQAETDYPEMVGKPPKKAKEEILKWAVYQLPAPYPLDYPAIIVSLDEAGEFKQQLRKADYCSFLPNHPLYDAVALINASDPDSRDELISDEAAQRWYSQEQKRIGVHGQPIIKIMPDRRMREAVTERIHPKVSQHYYELGLQAREIKEYNRWAECWRGALAIMPVDHQEGEERKNMASNIKKYLTQNANTLVYEIVMKGYLFALEWLVEEDKSSIYDWQDQEKNSLLMLAIQNRQITIAAWLLDQAGSDHLSAQPNAEGETPLHLVAAKGEITLAKRLLEKEEIKPNIKNKKGETPLSYARKNYQRAMQTLLMQHGATESTLYLRHAPVPVPVPPSEMKVNDIKESKLLQEQGLPKETLKKFRDMIRLNEARPYSAISTIGIFRFLLLLGLILGSGGSFLIFLYCNIRHGSFDKAILPRNPHCLTDIYSSQNSLGVCHHFTIFPSAPYLPPISLPLQDELVTACQMGDLESVQNAIARGAISHCPNSQDRQPLCAAVWGMNPAVVNALLQQMGGVSPMTWEECEAHNMKHYDEVFIITKFEPQTFGDWYQLLLKMDPNPFIRAYHLMTADQAWHNKNSASWDALKNYAKDYMGESRGWRDGGMPMRAMMVIAEMVLEVEEGYVSFRTQIKQCVESAKRPSVVKSF